MKRYFKLFIFIFMTFLITGCGNKNILSIKDFSKSMEKLGYKVEDVTDKVDDNNILSYYVASRKDYSYQIEYCGFDNTDSAIKYYREKLKKYTNSKGNQLNNKKNKETFYINGNYIIISRVKNVVMFTYAEKKYKDEINHTFGKLKY